MARLRNSPTTSNEVMAGNICKECSNNIYYINNNKCISCFPVISPNNWTNSTAVKIRRRIEEHQNKNNDPYNDLY